MKATRSPPRSEPAKSHDFRPGGTPRGARSSGLFFRQTRPCSRKTMKAFHRSLLNMWAIALAMGLCFDMVACLACIQSCSCSTRGRTSRCRASSRLALSRALIRRSMSKMASIFFTASSATGDMSCPGFFRRAFSLISASSKNLPGWGFQTGRSARAQDHGHRDRARWNRHGDRSEARPSTPQDVGSDGPFPCREKLNCAAGGA